MKIIEGNIAAPEARVAIVVARFNSFINDSLVNGALDVLKRQGQVQESNLTLVRVPGAVEIPLAAKKLAKSGQYDAIVALGTVIRGGTYHFELVANESGAGVSRVALDFSLPVANAVLTVENLKQAKARQTEKAVDAARVAVEMALLMPALFS